MKYPERRVMPNSNELFNLADYLAANPGKKLGVTDYLHAVFKMGALPNDVLLSFVKFFWPALDVVDGRIYLSESFDSVKYSEYLANGRGLDEVQLWLNLTEITGIFEDVDIDDALEIASIITKIWNEKIRSEIGAIEDSARVIFEEDEGEVFVTIDRTV